MLLDLDLSTPPSTKALFSGRHVHKIKSQYASMKGRKNPNAGRPSKNNTTALGDRDDESIRKSINRSRKNLKQHFLCNFYESYTFITLTFADTEAFDIRDVKQCVEQFNRFKKRLAMRIQRHKKQEPLKCLGVIEFQDKIRNGVPHFHLACNVTSMTVKELETVWGLGSVDLKRINGSAYKDPKIMYYLMKGIEDPRLNVLGQRFLTSKGLDKPHEKIVLNEASFDEAVQKLKPISSECYTYQSPYTGEVYNEEHLFKHRKDVIYLEELCQ
ncbi:rolling circle replication-associated protein [Solibacillus ferritrahens]|uniref:rolling circle replication-associated protein n=1 Tax=Solibacillus ferritrahens TaxID=3098620 RepID=UPI00300904DE